ncbi:unnamed protein product [Mesocestoides corti]|uniref:Uncharacterized protein n=2 Tax=Mesocestoides corti TaxID=53468 RepID=A0A0R3U621_MESCO|nr:unnamed protein product [Mesocestoides corti]
MALGKRDSVEPLLQRYARLRASNFRASGASRHQDSTTTSAGTATNPAARIFMPRPVVLSAVGPNPCLLAAVRASVGSSECSELSSITRSIEPASRGVAGHADAIPVCRRCLSHASSSSCGGDGGGGGVGGGGGCGAAERAEGSEGDDSCGGTFRFDRRPKTEPQAYYETLGSRIEMLNSTSARSVLAGCVVIDLNSTKVIDIVGMGFFLNRKWLCFDNVPIHMRFSVPPRVVAATALEFGECQKSAAFGWCICRVWSVLRNRLSATTFHLSWLRPQGFMREWISGGGVVVLTLTPTSPPTLFLSPRVAFLPSSCMPACLLAIHALSTTFRPIGEPSSNPETDPETEGVSSSSRSSRFEEAQGGVVRGTSVGPCGTASSAADDTLTGLPRRSASPDGMESSVYHPVCRLCLRELARVAEGSTTVCASVDCVASFHQACFLISHVITMQSSNEILSRCSPALRTQLVLACPCVRASIDYRLSRHQNRCLARLSCRLIAHKSASSLLFRSGLVVVSHTHMLPRQDECETETGSLYCPVCGRVWTTALTPTNPPDDARKLQAPRCAEDAHCVASSWAPGVAIVSTRLAPSNGDNIFLHSHVIPGLKDSLDDWKSAFSEEVAMGIISPYWHVRQSALRQVAKITICRVLMARRSPSITFHQSEGSTPNKLGPESLRMSFRLIQYFLSDPADEVFIASLCQHEGNKMFFVEFQPVGYIAYIASAATPHPLRCSLELEFHTKRESSFHHNCRSPVESPTWVVDSLATKFSSHKFAFSSLQCRVDEKEEGGGGGGE